MKAAIVFTFDMLNDEPKSMKGNKASYGGVEDTLGLH